MYCYDETGGERDGEKGGARGLDQIVMKDRGVGAGNCRQARVPPGWTPKWLLTHHIYQPSYYPPLVHFYLYLYFHWSLWHSILTIIEIYFPSVQDLR